jgi:hypothetical protein
MGKNKRKRSPRYKQKMVALEKLDIELPNELSEYLEEEEILLLKCMVANYTIQDLAVVTGYNRNYIMERLIDLGRALEAFRLVEEKIFPEDVPNVDYLKGWNDCKKYIRRTINGKLNWRKTVENRDPRAKGEGEGAFPEREES